MSGAIRPSRLLAWLAALLLVFGAAPAFAAVKITFYSKELSDSFPHAFVILDGTLDRTGERIAEDYGFSAKTISPAILMGRVKGQVITDHSPSYVKASDPHFSLVLSDDEYDRVMATVARWREWKQPSYDLGTHNCIHFVAEIAASLGMNATVPKNLTRRPRSYLQHLVRENRTWLTAHNAVLLTKSGAG